jgi:ElaB/YqjD/DUF883 family membrane-anchored ribosome-binding protein
MAQEPKDKRMETYFSNMTATEGTTAKLVQDLMTLVHDAEELVKATGGDLAGKSKIELNAALERVKASCSRLQVKVAAGARQADQIIREHPYQSVGIAFGVGLLIGVLVNRD